MLLELADLLGKTADFVPMLFLHFLYSLQQLFPLPCYFPQTSNEVGFIFSQLMNGPCQLVYNPFVLPSFPVCFSFPPYDQLVQLFILSITLTDLLISLLQLVTVLFQPSLAEL